MSEDSDLQSKDKQRQQYSLVHGQYNQHAAALSPEPSVRIPARNSTIVDGRIVRSQAW